MSDIVLSGIRATGRLHFGNFIGAVQNFVLQQSGNNTCLYFIADWHTLTTLENPSELRGNLIEIVMDYIAAGLDPERSIIYAQSSVPEIAELSLYLGMLQPLGELELIPTYKDLVKKQPDRVSHGLLSYPVLMAADILGPQATLVPVGEDQVPNVELARELAKRFNSRFGPTFSTPRMLPNMVKVPGLDGAKMGKSDDNSIDIGASIDDIRTTYHTRGVTDVERRRRDDPGDPYNRCRSVYAVHELVTQGEIESRSIAKVCMNAEIGCRSCKDILVDNIAQILEPFQERRAALTNQRDYIKDVLIEGGRKARDMIRPTVESVRDKMGIIIYD